MPKQLKNSADDEQDDEREDKDAERKRIPHGGRQAASHDGVVANTAKHPKPTPSNPPTMMRRSGRHVNTYSYHKSGAPSLIVSAPT